MRFCRVCAAPVPPSKGNKPRVACSSECRRRANIGHPFGEMLTVTCWCERTIVWVHRDAIKCGQTRSCGRPGCQMPMRRAA